MQEKRSLATATDVKSPVFTSETTSGTAPEPIIHDRTKNVNSNNSDIKFSFKDASTAGATADTIEDAKREWTEKGKITQADIQTIQSIRKKSVNDFTSGDIKKTEAFAKKYFNEMGVKSPFFRAWFGDWRAKDKTPIHIVTEKGSNRGVVKNNDTSWDINVSEKVFNESQHRGVNNQKALPYLEYINSIVENAVLLDSYTVPSNKSKSENSAMMHSLYAVADIGNGEELIKLFVEELNDVNSDGTIKRAYQLQNIENQQLSVQGSEKNPSPIAQTADVTTISDLFALVKQNDKNFKPKDCSLVLNEDGTPKVVYHGMSEFGFTVFDPKKTNDNLSLFFTDGQRKRSL